MWGKGPGNFMLQNIKDIYGRGERYCPLKSAYGNNNIEGKTEVIMTVFVYFHAHDATIHV